MRRRGRRDANHQAIVDGFRRVGCSVLDLGNVGDGCPDLLVGVPSGRMLGEGDRWSTSINLLVEIKDGTRKPSEQRLTEAEAAFIDGWRGGRVFVVRSLAEALALVGVRM